MKKVGKFEKKHKLFAIFYIIFICLMNIISMSVRLMLRGGGSVFDAVSFSTIITLIFAIPFGYLFYKIMQKAFTNPKYYFVKVLFIIVFVFQVFYAIIYILKAIFS